MAMKLIVGRIRANDILTRVHLDDTKLNQDGSPDLAWVWEATWGLNPPPGRTAAQYRADIFREGKALALVELANRQAARADQATLGTSLPGEGQVF